MGRLVDADAFDRSPATANPVDHPATGGAGAGRRTRRGLHHAAAARPR